MEKPQLIKEEDADSEMCIESVTELDISDDCKERQKNHTLSTIAVGLDKASAAPVYGSVSVNSSDNVHFGNNTYFNGPVVIRQVVHPGEKSGVDNASYTKTEGSNEFHTCKLPLKDALGDPLQIAPFHLRIVSRSDWLAQPADKPLDIIKQPIPWVIIAHTAAESCSTQSECVLRVRLVQMFHMESRGWDDIGYNFLVGGDGSAYQGRGWDYVGAHTKGYNYFGICIAFIGTFTKQPPPEQQLAALKKLLELGVRLGKLSADYKLLGHRQLMSTQSPGNAAYNVISKWPHFAPNITFGSKV